MVTSCSQIFYRKSLILGQAAPSALLFWKPPRKGDVETQNSMFSHHFFNLRLHTAPCHPATQLEKVICTMIRIKIHLWVSKWTWFALIPAPPPSAHCLCTHTTKWDSGQGKLLRNLLSFSMLLPFLQRIGDKTCLLVSSNMCAVCKNSEKW